MATLLPKLGEAIRAWRVPRRPPDAIIAPAFEMPELLGVVGVALLRSSRATSTVESILDNLSHAYARSDVRAYVLPTLILVEDPSGSTDRTAIFPATGGSLRLDQAGAVDKLVALAGDTCMPAADVVRELKRIERASPRFGALARILGHAVLTVGFGLVLNPVAAAIPMYLTLGLLVGAIVVLAERLPSLALILPVFTSFTLTVLTALVIAPIVGDDPIRLVTPALVSFLPGLTLTLAAVELVNRQVVSGASRMIFGAAQLGLLVFGVLAAFTILDTHPAGSSPAQLGAWAPWLGVALTAVGYTLFSVAPRGAFLWILLALMVAFGGQLLGAVMVGNELSGFVGAVAVIVTVNLLGRTRLAPPSAVMLTCAYWLLVPGALGFIGLSQVAEGIAGVATVVAQTVVSLVAIAIGMVAGAGVSRDATLVSQGWRHDGHVDTSASARPSNRQADRIRSVG